MNSITHTNELNSLRASQPAQVQHRSLGPEAEIFASNRDRLTLQEHGLISQEPLKLSFSEAINDVRKRTAALVESFRAGKTPFNLEVMVNSKGDVERMLSA